MPRRVDIGALLGAAGALLLLVSLFLDWYEVTGNIRLTAWDAFELTDLLLALVALAALGAAAERLGFGRRMPRLTIAVAGGVALLLVAVQLLNPPPVLAVVDDTTIATGGWLALSGAALMFAGGVFSLARVSLSLSFEERDREMAIRRDQRAAAAPAPPAERAEGTQTMPLEQRKD